MEHGKFRGASKNGGAFREIRAGEGLHCCLEEVLSLCRKPEAEAERRGTARFQSVSVMRRKGAENTFSRPCGTGRRGDFIS